MNFVQVRSMMMTDMNEAFHHVRLAKKTIPLDGFLVDKGDTKAILTYEYLGRVWEFDIGSEGTVIRAKVNG